MTYTRPAIDEFEILENGVLHKPTGAAYTAYKGMPLHSVMLGMLGSVLPDGRDYRKQDVDEMASRIWTEELRRRGYNA